MARVRDISFVAALFAALLAPLAAKAQTAVPFVGCEGEGMTGHANAPPPRATPKLANEAAKALAYYASPDLAALAPRGWKCDFVFGSSGTFLTIKPPGEDDGECRGVFAAHMYGGTSGRFDVAKIAARIFPSAQAYVQGVIDEKLPGSDDIHFGAYKTDKLTRLGPNIVEYETPPRATGLGDEAVGTTHPWPIRGVAILMPKQYMDVQKLDLCLPPAQAGLGSTILKAFEAEVAAGVIGKPMP